MGQETSKAVKPDAERKLRERTKTAAETQSLQNGADRDRGPRPRIASSPRPTGRRSPSPPMQSPRHADYYRPRRRSISPPFLGRDYTLDRPPNSDDLLGHPDRAPAPNNPSPRSPEHARVAQAPKSHIQHRSQPPRRSSPPRRALSANFQSSSRSYDETSPANRPSGTSAIRSPSLHSPAFEAPIKPPISLELNDRRASAASPAGKIKFNGLADVPTGPKNAFNAERPLGVAFVSSRPQIFIHTSHLPALPTTRKHLAKFIKVSESDIVIETNHGWRILFPESSHGRDQLDKCYHEFHLQLLFREYVLNMRCYPNGNVTGQDYAEYADQRWARSTQAFTDKTVAEGNAVDPTSNVDPFRDTIRDLASSRLTTAQQPLAPPARRDGPVSRRGSSTLAPIRPSSALARAEKDDSSTPSVTTTSETSASKRPRCHVCRNPAVVGLEPLFPCTTCSRMYHRRCHKKQAVPADQFGLSHWQCQRCVKKQVAPSSRLSSSSVPAASPTRPTGSRQKQGDAATANPQDRGEWPMRATPDAMSAKSELVNPAIDKIFTDSSEANDLVEKEFGMGKLQERQQKGTHRVELVRKKKAPADEGGAGSSETKTLHHGPGVPADTECQSGKRKLTDGDDPKARKAQKLSNDDDVMVKRNGAHPPTEAAPAKTSAEASIDDTVMALDDGDDMNNAAASIANSHLQPMLQHPDGDSADESPKPKKKPHKWSGGGADRDIIKIGLDTLFQSAPSSKLVSAEQTTTVSTPAVSSKDEGMPNAVQKGYESDDRSPVDLAHNAEDPAASDHEIGRQRRQGPAPKRNPQGKCANCQRIIPLNPSGSNTHCTKCKREAKEKSAPKDLNAASTASGHQSPGAPEEPATMASSAKALKELPMPQSEKEAMTNDNPTPAPEQGDVVNGAAEPASSQPASGKLKRVDQRTACEECRKYHKRCHHTAAHTASDDNDVYAIEQTPNKRSAGLSEDATRGDRSSSDDERLVSEEEAAPVPPANVKKRSFQSVAKDEYDLGNGWERPKGTYQKLIGMALCSVEGQRMASNDIVQWIADNIDGYSLKKGNKWEDGIRATISMNRSRPEGEKPECKRLWRADPIDPEKKSKGNIIELLPGIEETMLHWDPVLKMPVSPVKLDRRAKTKVGGDSADKPKHSKNQMQQSRVVPAHEDLPPAPKSTQPEEAQRGQRLEAQTQQHDGLHADLDVDMQDVNDTPLPQVESTLPSSSEKDADESSDDEPLLRRKRVRRGESSKELEQPTTGPRPSAPSTAAISRTEDSHVADYSEPLQASLEVAPVTQAQDVPRTESPTRKAPSENSPSLPVPSDLVPSATVSSARVPSPSVSSDPVPSAPVPTAAAPSAPVPRLHIDAPDAPALTVEQVIKREAMSVEYSATSLFDEWPEYKPFDKAAKLAEIQARPTRKQRFRMPLGRDSWAEMQLTNAVDSSDYWSRRGSAQRDRPTRGPNKTQRLFDPWQYGTSSTGVKVCETWEEFFDLPPNPIPILQDGHLAFRDGTQNDDGTLPRAKVIYKTGYA